jgi:murein DD-endopeptidase MepM/ murein hydrolase activator NlpD
MKAIWVILIYCLVHFEARAQAYSSGSPDTLPKLGCPPLKKLFLTSGFGYRLHPVTRKYAFHAGVDLRARSDTVFAIIAGTVTVGYNNLLGVFLVIKDGDIQVIYGHLSMLFAFTGDKVTTAMPVGITGATGRVTGEHLHFSIKYGNKYLDPLLFLTVLLNRPRSP